MTNVAGYMPPPHRWEHYALKAVVCLSVRLSVSCLQDPKSRMEGLRKLQIGTKEAHDTIYPWSHLEIERSNVKVTRPINATTENQPYVWNGNAW